VKTTAMWFDKQVILDFLDSFGATLNMIGADQIARDLLRQLKEAGIVEVVTRPLP
jgi:hypothetical protein